MAWLPPSRHAVYRALRIPDLRKGDDSPLRTSFRRAAPATCRPPRLSPPRSPPCGLNGTFQTQSRPCAEGSSPLSSDACHAAHAAALHAEDTYGREVYDAVVLGHVSLLRL